MQTERIMLDGIEVGANRRPLDPGNVERLKTSIAEIGLQTPITVMALAAGDDTRMILVAGAHRLEALRQIGEEAAHCVVIEGDQDAADLWEIDENFARAELTDAQRAEHHVRREAILVRRGEVKDSPQGGRPPKNLDNLSKYSARASVDLGVDERTVRRDLARGKKIAPDILAEVSGTDLDKGVVLDELARVPRSRQPEVLEDIRARRDAHKVNREHDKVIALTEAQQFADWIMARVDLNELPQIIAWLHSTRGKDVAAALQREAA